MITVLSINFLGGALRDLLDVRKAEDLGRVALRKRGGLRLFGAAGVAR